MAVRASAKRIGAVIVLSSALVACGDRAQDKSVSLENYTAEEIYRRGELQLETGKRPADALHYFEEIGRAHV